MFNLETHDFTISKYSKLCETIAENYPTITMSEYITKRHPTKFILMRHDSDRYPENALKTAFVEMELGIKATYYFRMNNGVFQPDIIEKIYEMGHEIGYHYETLSDAKGNYEKAIKLFDQNLKKFQKICDIKTISMHGRSLSKYDNRDLWKVYDYTEFDILGEAYLSAGKELNYFSDTGRSWSSKNSVRDFIPGAPKQNDADTTDDLIELIKSKKLDNLYLLTHPERWSLNNYRWLYFYLFDFTINLGKKGIMAVRK